MRGFMPFQAVDAFFRKDQGFQMNTIKTKQAAHRMAPFVWSRHSYPQIVMIAGLVRVPVCCETPIRTVSLRPRI